MAKCKGCGKEIVWITTISGKSMPCDAEKTTIITDEGRAFTGHIHHWATCPKAQDFKKKEKEE